MAELPPGLPAPAAADARQQNHTLDLFELHIPKCGSGLGAVLRSAVRAGFATHSPSRMPSAEHQSLTRREDCAKMQQRLSGYTCFQQQRATVAMFRSPGQRQMSAYNYIKAQGDVNASNPKSHGRCCTRDWGWKTDVFTSVKRRINLLNEPAQTTIGRFPGCFVRMILGHGCMAAEVAMHSQEAGKLPHGLNTSDVDHAIALVQSFLFVGDTSEWHLSICLFNRIVRGVALVTVAQLADTRPTNRSDYRSARANAVQIKEQKKIGLAQSHDTSRYASYSHAEYDTSGLPYDWADEAVYAAVTKRFRRDLSTYKITSVGDCPVVSTLPSALGKGKDDADHGALTLAAGKEGELHRTQDPNEKGEDQEDAHAREAAALGQLAVELDVGTAASYEWHS